MQLAPHLLFDGTCEQAFKFYERALKGKIAMLARYSDTPAADQMPADSRHKIIHAQLNAGDFLLLGGDAPPGRYAKPQGFTVAFLAGSQAEAERVFAALADNGKVGIAMAETFFATRFGMVTDAFGIPWMVLHQKQSA